MIRVVTVVGVEEFEEADAYTVSPPNLPGTTSYITTASMLPAQTLPGSLKLWKMDPSGGEDHTLIAWFSPNGWVAIDFREAEPVTQLPPMGFRHAKDDEQVDWEPEDRAQTRQPSPRPRTTSRPTPKTIPVER
jgi:hypothetical protein